MSAAAPRPAVVWLVAGIAIAIVVSALAIAAYPAEGREVDPRAFWREALVAPPQAKRHAPRFIKRKARPTREARRHHAPTQGRVPSQAASKPSEPGTRDEAITASRVPEAFALAAELPLQPVPVRAIALTAPPYAGAIVASRAVPKRTSTAFNDGLCIGGVLVVMGVAFLVVSRVAPANRKEIIHV